MSKDIERMRIRAKLSDVDRDFLDAIRELFPSAKLTHLLFSDGEEIGKADRNTAAQARPRGR